MTATLEQNLDKVKALAPDLSKGFPRSPRETIADYAIAARCIDKCRASLVGQNGEYHYACPLDSYFLKFAGLDPEALKAFVATGADDAAVAEYIKANAVQKDREAVLAWTNARRETKLSDLPGSLQAYMEDYIVSELPKGSLPFIKVWFDVYDIEEKRISVG